jgi:hypothetical protein
MAFQLPDSQQVRLSLAFVDKKGNPAPVDGKPEWQVDNPNVLALVPSDDGLSCLVQAMGPLGPATVSVKADADMGEGVQPIAGLFEVMVTAGPAASVVITAGTPEEQP